MPDEIEAKFRVEQLAIFAERVRNINGNYLDTIDQEDQFFDTPDRQLLNTDCGLRLRREQIGQDIKSTLCFKGPLQDGPFKRREEIELELVHDDLGPRLLEVLGYIPTLSVKKNRQMWQVDDCLICLDNVAGLGCFIEIEGPDEASIKGIVEQMGLQGYQHISSSYVKMLAELLTG
ncbi:MAG: class IV adenylate cyclase [Sedimentisphaerales bacterium]|nr:class IV adenylate cyclase [Sedimentisphaerales bacterium]